MWDGLEINTATMFIEHVTQCGSLCFNIFLNNGCEEVDTLLTYFFIVFDCSVPKAQEEST